MGGKRRSATAEDGIAENELNPERVEAARRRKQKLLITWGFIFIALVMVVAVAWSLLPKPSPYTGFAKCVTASGAVMYGTEWCNHCQSQKRQFGAAFREIVFVNCDATLLCVERNVTGYPTWILGDGTRLEGEVPLSFLAEKTGCTLPVQE